MENLTRQSPEIKAMRANLRRKPKLIARTALEAQAFQPTAELVELLTAWADYYDALGEGREVKLFVFSDDTYTEIVGMLTFKDL